MGQVAKQNTGRGKQNYLICAVVTWNYFFKTPTGQALFHNMLFGIQSFSQKYILPRNQSETPQELVVMELGAE